MENGIWLDTISILVLLGTTIYGIADKRRLSFCTPSTALLRRSSVHAQQSTGVAPPIGENEAHLAFDRGRRIRGETAHVQTVQWK
jgi:hypothetical protein